MPLQSCKIFGFLYKASFHESSHTFTYVAFTYVATTYVRKLVLTMFKFMYNVMKLIYSHTCTMWMLMYRMV